MEAEVLGKKIKILMAFVFFFSAGCSTLSVDTMYDRNEDFSWYETFTIFGGENLPGNTLNKTPLLREQINDMVKNVLMQKGYTYKSTGNFDFVIYVYGKLREMRQPFVSVSDSAIGASRIVGQAADLTQESLFIDVVNTMKPGEKRLVWRGRGVRFIENISQNPDSDIGLRETIAKILADFPP
jgi:hypothetical protein